MNVNRRNFLTTLAGVAGGIALEHAIPFGRVWSFPRKIVLAKHPGLTIYPTVCVSELMMQRVTMHDIYWTRDGNVYCTKSVGGHILATEKISETFDGYWKQQFNWVEPSSPLPIR